MNTRLATKDTKMTNFLSVLADPFVVPLLQTDLTDSSTQAR